MGVMINRRREMGGKSLPYDAEIEYLESSTSAGYPYIDTGIYPSTSGYKAHCKFMPTSIVRWGNFFGIYSGDTARQNSKNSFKLNINPSNCFSLCVNGTDIPSNVLVQQNIDFEIELTPEIKLYIDGVLRLNSPNRNTVYTEGPIYLFTVWDYLYRNNTYPIDTTEYITMRVYYFKLYTSDGVLVKDLIPVRVGTTGYMYDKVSKQLFGNSGTGSFILGPDK